MGAISDGPVSDVHDAQHFLGTLLRCPIPSQTTGPSSLAFSTLTDSSFLGSQAEAGCSLHLLPEML